MPRKFFKIWQYGKTQKESNICLSSGCNDGTPEFKCAPQKVDRAVLSHKTPRAGCSPLGFMCFGMIDGGCYSIRIRSACVRYSMCCDWITWSAASRLLVRTIMIERSLTEKQYIYSMLMP